MQNLDIKEIRVGNRIRNNLEDIQGHPYPGLVALAK